ncbi:MAG: hypothetical protein O2945_12040 [Planctomycetota bacterium]|nr:hypothetical protein [Planctomycetota bacterium]MDA0919790.1 hypothetical protein [Planctomycetota bacterium]
MLRRLSILTILASWLFAWFSASVHMHHPGQDCQHGVTQSDAGATRHSHSSTTHTHSHSHVHVHGQTAHKHSESSEPVDKTSSENLPSVSGDCPLCSLIALQLAATPLAEVAPSDDLIAEAQLPPVAAPASAARYSLRGRAPPV